MRVSTVILPLVWLLGGCSSGAFDLVVRVPAKYADAVVAIRVEVLEPPVNAPFDCDDIAFGLLDQAVLPVSRDRQVILRAADEAPLGDLERAGARVFLAEGLSAEGPLLIGCAEAKELDATELILELEPRVFVVGLEVPNLSGVVGQISTDPIELRVLDHLEEPAAGVRARWSTTDGSDTPSHNQGESDPEGLLFVTPSPPLTPGPYVVDVRVRWGNENPLRAEAFVRAPEVEVPLELDDLFDAKVLRIGPEGEEAVALLLSEVRSAAVATTLRLCTGAPFNCDDVFELPEDAPGRLVLIEGEPPALDRLMIVTPDAWYELDLGGGISRIADGPGGVPDDAALSGPCEEGSDRILLHYGGADHDVFDIGGNLLPDKPLQDLEVEFLTSGCVATVDGRRLRTFVLRNDFDDIIVVAFDEEEGGFYAEWPALGEGITITDLGGGLILGTQLDLNDFVISRAVLSPFPGGGMSVEAVDADYTPFPPLVTAGGDLDGDQNLDVVSILIEYLEQSFRFVLWAATDDVLDDQRITGSIDLDDLNLCEEGAPLLFLADVDGDTRDDILLLDLAAPFCGAAPRLILLPMGR